MTDAVLGEVLLIGLTAAVMAVGLVGAIVPVLPGAWLVWLAALGYGLAQPLLGQPVFDGWVGGVAMAFITVLALVDLALEYAVTHYVASREGVSFKAILASVALGLLGLPFFPPIGPLVGAVAGLFLVEYQRHGRDMDKARQAVIAYARGRGWAILAEIALCLLMIGLWVGWLVIAALV